MNLFEMLDDNFFWPVFFFAEVAHKRVKFSIWLGVLLFFPASLRLFFVRLVFILFACALPFIFFLVFFLVLFFFFEFKLIILTCKLIHFFLSWQNFALILFPFTWRNILLGEFSGQKRFHGELIILHLFHVVHGNVANVRTHGSMRYFQLRTHLSVCW